MYLCGSHGALGIYGWKSCNYISMEAVGPSVSLVQILLGQCKGVAHSWAIRWSVLLSYVRNLQDFRRDHLSCVGSDPAAGHLCHRSHLSSGNKAGESGPPQEQCQYRLGPSRMVLDLCQFHQPQHRLTPYATPGPSYTFGTWKKKTQMR